MIFVRTGPWAGNDSVIASDWNRTTASVIIGWNTPDAPFQGSVRSSTCKPSSFKPSVYAFSHSLRDWRSLSMSPAKSPAIDSMALSSISSARLTSKSFSASTLASSMANPGPSMVTASGSTISISIPSSSCASASMPCGCWKSALSMFVAMLILNSRRLRAHGKTCRLSHPSPTR